MTQRMKFETMDAFLAFRDEVQRLFGVKHEQVMASIADEYLIMPSGAGVRECVPNPDGYWPIVHMTEQEFRALYS